jgi:hypothetical protein
MEDVAAAAAKKERAKAARREKRQLRDNEVVRTVYDRAYNRLRGQLSRLRQEQALVEAYAADGWRGASREKVKPVAEIKRAKEQIARCRESIRECVRVCDEAEGDEPIPAELYDSEGELDLDHIFCSKCRGNDSDDVGGAARSCPAGSAAARACARPRPPPLTAPPVPPPAAEQRHHPLRRPLQPRLPRAVPRPPRGPRHSARGRGLALPLVRPQGEPPRPPPPAPAPHFCTPDTPPRATTQQKLPVSSPDAVIFGLFAAARST